MPKPLQPGQDGPSATPTDCEKHRAPAAEQAAGHVGGADIPGDMPVQEGFLEPQTIAFGGHETAGMIANDQHRRGQFTVQNGERRAFGLFDF